MRIFHPLTLCLCLAFPATAQIAGRDDPAFTTALTEWLKGNDETALPAMAALANANNRAAQLFLGQIEPLDGLHAHISGKLPRKERIALMREQVGLSGRNWLVAASADTPLAAALWNLRDDKAAKDALTIVLDAGEARAVFQPMMTQMNQSFEGMLTGLEQSFHPTIEPYAGQIVLYFFPYLRSVILDGTAGDLDPERVAALGLKANALADTPLSRQLLWIGLGRETRTLADPSPERDEITAALGDDPAMAPIRGVCQAICPASIDACLLTLTVVGASYWPLFTSGLSPIEALVPTETYRASARINGDVLRTVAHNAPADATPATYPNLDQCTLDAVFANR